MNAPKKLVCVSLIILAGRLSACAPVEFEDYPDGTPGKTTDVLTTDNENALPVESQLILGTLLLEGTDQAVDAGQAAVLLPLWQEWHDLSRSNTAAPGDREALIKQIQSAMTQEQFQAIAAMELTQEDVLEYVQENGVGFPSRPTATPDAQNPDGGPSSGDGDDDDRTSDAGQTPTLSPDEWATLQAIYPGGYGGFRGLESALLHALIQLLESKQGQT